MTNIEKLIEKYGIKVIKIIPEKYSNLNYVIIYGVHINMHELIEYLKVSDHIASYKHLIGCEVEFNNHTHIFNGTYEFKYLFNLSSKFMLKKLKFYLDDESLGTYKEYMQLHYPEYEYIWKQQL